MWPLTLCGQTNWPSSNAPTCSTVEEASRPCRYRDPEGGAVKRQEVKSFQSERKMQWAEARRRRLRVAMGIRGSERPTPSSRGRRLPAVRRTTMMVEAAAAGGVGGVVVAAAATLLLADAIGDAPVNVAGFGGGQQAHQHQTRGTFVGRHASETMKCS
jgi:hypothetical protein